MDAIKRWRLARQGLSSGRKRRVHSENPVVLALEDSFWVKLALYVTFAVTCAGLILRSSPANTISFDAATPATDPFMRANYGFIVAVIAIVMFQTILSESCRRNSRVVLVLGGIAGHLMMLRAIMTLVDNSSIPELFRYFAVPFALAPMLHGVLLGRAVASFSAIFVTLIGCLLVPEQSVIEYMILSLASGMTSVLLAYQVRKRSQLLRVGLYVGAITLVIGVALGRLDVFSVFGPEPVRHLRVLGAGGAVAFGTAVLTALVISGLLPLFEGAFHLTTDISWLELSDLNHKLLRQMQLEAPGTFHHSLVVASLAEAAAEKIGANAPMCRVCAYFHDVGKLKKPNYFIENQHDGAENPHDALTPTMSSLIIIAHVKDGVDLAIKHKLNPRVIDIIQEHHGDSLVYYFYRRAQEQKKAEMEKVDRRLENPEDLPHIEEKNFRYPGPRPDSRESGIVCLADTIESASRSLKKPTPAKIRTLVDDLIRAKVNDGQLDDCPLTIRELAILRESFAGTLRSMLHSRIDYPKEKEKDDATGTKRITSDGTQGGRVIPMPKRA